MTFGVWDSSQKEKAFRLCCFKIKRSKVFYNLSSKSQQIYSMFFLVLSTFKKILGQKTAGTVGGKKKYNVINILEISKYFFIIFILLNDFVDY